MWKWLFCVIVVIALVGTSLLADNKKENYAIVMLDVDLPGALDVAALGINARGDIVGRYTI